MADRVQYVLDRMSSVFHQLIQLKLFSEVSLCLIRMNWSDDLYNSVSQDEVSSIINRRRDFEYLIMRRQLEPSDYYSYIQYETNLFKLINIRHNKEAAANSSDVALIRQQRHVCALMVRHISYVFERAIRRFPAEMDFWMEYVAFLKESKSMSLLNNVRGQAISLHPMNDIFWSLAAVRDFCSSRHSDERQLFCLLLIIDA
jgi:hypothetical protein